MPGLRKTLLKHRRCPNILGGLSTNIGYFQLIGRAILCALCIFSEKLNIHDEGRPVSVPPSPGTRSEGPYRPRPHYRCVEQTIFPVGGGILMRGFG